MLRSIDAIILRHGNTVKYAARIETVRRYLHNVSPLCDYQVVYFDWRDKKPRRVTGEGFLTINTEEVAS